jgi:adenosine deaminase
MSTLLITLGTSPAIVPEAYLLPGVRFRAVHVLTTSSIREGDVGFVEGWFRERAAGVELTVTRVAEFEDFRSERDHFQFEEVLYRWWLEKAGGDGVYVCLTGGFKTMSAAMQKAAAVLGAAEVFHVLAGNEYPDPRGGERLVPASTAEQIQDSRERGRLHWIRLGGESGWPQLQQERAEDYPLEEVRREGKQRWVRAGDDLFRRHLRGIVERSHHIAGAWEEMRNLPFPVLATWSPLHLAWLRERVDPAGDREWVRMLPKVELHCHLGGFGTDGEALDEVRGAAERPEALRMVRGPRQPEGWPEPGGPIPLTEYMKLGDDNGSALLTDPGCLRRQCEMLYRHFRGQRVLYAEVRCSPANYVTAGRSPWQVLSEIRDTFERCMGENPGCHVNLILIATRRESGDYRAAISRHLALAVSAAEHWTGEGHCRVVGVDLAGYEDRETRAHYFREEFTGVHRCGLALTVHAGENDDAEGIWRAVFDLNTRRIGHALHLVDSPELMRSVAHRGIGVEMCPYANYQIKGFTPMAGKAEYPLKRYLEEGIRVTVNTDNIGISGASLTDNLLLAVRMNPGLTRLDVIRLGANAIDVAFISPSARAALRAGYEAALAIP